MDISKEGIIGKIESWEPLSEKEGMIKKMWHLGQEKEKMVNRKLRFIAKETK